MTEVREYKVTVLEEATKEMMLKERYKLEIMGNDEWLVHEELNSIDEKLKEIDRYNRRVSKIDGGFKNRKR